MSGIAKYGLNPETRVNFQEFAKGFFAGSQPVISAAATPTSAPSVPVHLQRDRV